MGWGLCCSWLQYAFRSLQAECEWSSQLLCHMVNRSQLISLHYRSRGHLINKTRRIVGVLYGLTRLEKHKIIAKVASLTKKDRHIYSHEEDRENMPIEVSIDLIPAGRAARALPQSVHRQFILIVLDYLWLLMIISHSRLPLRLKNLQIQFSCIFLMASGRGTLRKNTTS